MHHKIYLSIFGMQSGFVEREQMYQVNNRVCAMIILVSGESHVV